MTKLLIVLGAIVLFSGCVKQPTNKNLVATNANKAAESAPATTMTQAEMEVREKATWEALVKKNYGQYAEMLADDYLDVEYGGVFDKAALVKLLPDLAISDTVFSDWKMLPINKDAVIITYNVTYKSAFKGQPNPPGPYRTTSVWANRNQKWVAVFYQQTAVDTTPPPTIAAPTPKSTASPNEASAKPIETGPDPVANEKAVWESFRNKNYEDFASVLLPEFVEVEAEAVYDKAGSVKGVSMFDAGRFELSDWKTVKIDNESSVVTYLVKLPGQPLFRHSSIWANRNGKWLAFFHQGTPETPPKPAKPAAQK
jgi:hypothetical protein